MMVDPLVSPFSLGLRLKKYESDWEGVIPSRAKIRLGRLGQTNVSHTFKTFNFKTIFGLFFA